MPKSIFITGGHYTPAKAVIETLIRSGEWKIFYVGRKFSFENDSAVSLEYRELSVDRKIKFLTIITGRLLPKWQLSNLLSIAKIPVGIAQSLFWLLIYRPVRILSFGGYVAFPIVLMGKILGIKVVTHEQTRSIGLSNRVIEMLSDKVCVSFPSQVNSGTKYVYTGNPLRNSIWNDNLNAELTDFRKLKQKTGLPVLYITGGNQGSHIINETIRGNLSEIVEKCLIIWQTGDNQQYLDFDNIKQTVASLKEKANRVLVYKFVFEDQIGGVFSLTDLVVGRSGANTVFEVAALMIPALFVPIPWSRGNEQMLNAKELESIGSAKIVEQDRVGVDLRSAIFEMLQDIKTYNQKAHDGKRLFVPDSVDRIISCLK